MTMETPNPLDLEHQLTDAEEFQSLLNDYRAASKQLLESEKEKQQNMLRLDQQKDLIKEQNDKIQELQRQFQVFESMMKEAHSAKDDQMKGQNEAFVKLEESLSSNLENVMRVAITKQITEKVNENMERQHAEQMAAAKAEQLRMTAANDQMVDLLR